MAALWMARCGVKARIIDARATKVFRGHADGMQTGTLDIFDSFGIVDELYKNAAPAVEMTFWVCGTCLWCDTQANFAHIGWY
jgi:phenol 2-monooxygenase (NADPH)